ncbi:hypothetical protein V8C86DRAFT_3022527 [Haematococcus lacustris]
MIAVPILICLALAAVVWLIFHAVQRYRQWREDVEQTKRAQQEGLYVPPPPPEVQATHLFAFDMYPPSPSPSSLPLVHQTRPSHYKGQTKVGANEDEAWRSMEDLGASGQLPGPGVGGGPPYAGGAAAACPLMGHLPGLGASCQVLGWEVGLRTQAEPLPACPLMGKMGAMSFSLILTR